MPSLEKNPEFFARYESIWCWTCGKVTSHERTWRWGGDVVLCARNAQILLWKESKLGMNNPVISTLRKQEHKFLRRNHPAKYGTLEQSNWKDLRVKANWKRIDTEIKPLLRVLNDNGFRTFSSCSGGHKRNMNRSNPEHEPGYICFFPVSSIVYYLYSAVKQKFRHFQFAATTETVWEKGGTKWIESSKFRWELKWNLPSKREYYYELFDEMLSVVRSARKGGVSPLEKRESARRNRVESV